MNKIMTTDEFLKIMADNSSDFSEFAALSDTLKQKVAEVNIITGCAEAFYDDNGKLQGVGGIRYKGVGEAWMLTPRNIQSHPDHTRRQSQFLDLLAVTKKNMLRMVAENEILQLYATGTLSTKFLEQVGFKRQDKVLIWTREA